MSMICKTLNGQGSLDFNALSNHTHQTLPLCGTILGCPFLAAARKHLAVTRLRERGFKSRTDFPPKNDKSSRFHKWFCFVGVAMHTAISFSFSFPFFPLTSHFMFAFGQSLQPFQTCTACVLGHLQKLHIPNDRRLGLDRSCTRRARH